MGESGWGQASGARGGGGPEAGARTAGRAREMPPSPAALRAAAESESAKEGASREDQLLRAQITAPPTLPPPNPAGPTPSAAEESGACSDNNSARPPAPPSPGAGAGGAGGGGGRRPPAEPETWPGEVADGSRVEGGSPSTYGAEGRRGGRGGETAGGADPGLEEAGRGEMRRQRHTATQEILRRETKGWSGGGDAEPAWETRPHRERRGRRLRRD